jgi:hypothetical protein
MKEVDTLPPFCYPLTMKIDMPLLLKSVEVLLNRLGLELDEINKRCNTNFGFTVNLTHLPELQGEDRWKKYNNNHLSVKQQGVSESNFTEHLLESQDLYIGKLVHELYTQHGVKFQGRAQLIWLGAKSSYNFHKDLHTPNRYHVPLITNEKCFWLLKNKEEIFKLHMPADGRAWYLDPINVEHTFCNESSTARLHLLLTSGF